MKTSNVEFVGGPLDGQTAEVPDEHHAICKDDMAYKRDPDNASIFKYEHIAKAPLKEDDDGIR